MTYSPGKCANALIDVMFHIEKSNTNPNSVKTPQEEIAVANKIMDAVFTSLDVGSTLLGVDSSKMNTVKKMDPFFPVVQVMTQFRKEYQQCDGKLSNRLQMLEKACIWPTLDAVRVFAEKKMLQEKAYLSEGVGWSSWQRQRDIYGWRYNPVTGQEGYVIVETRSLSEAESQLAFDQYQKLASQATIGRLAAEASLISKIVSDLYHDLARNVIEQQQSSAPLVQLDDAPVSSDFSLKAFDKIPRQLEEDVIFRKYICPISNRPIRDPVGDPNGATLYERVSILERLQENQTSPVTRLPLMTSQLIERPDLKALIDARLDEHSRVVRDLITEICKT